VTGKDRVLACFRHETVPPPWIPFAGVHAGKLVGYTARELYTDVDKLIEGMLAAARHYYPDGLPVMFDLQIEAEALGCGLLWSDDAPPTVAAHPLENSQEIPSAIPGPEEGRLPLALEATRRLAESIGERVALYGLCCGPFTLASHLRGTTLFMDMYDDPGYVERLLDYTTEVTCRVAELYAEAGAAVIASVDPLSSQVSPDHFTRFLTEPFTRVFDKIRSLGIPSSFFVCGDATKNIEVMCATGPDGISVDENVDLPSAKPITDRHNVAIAGNLPLASVMLFGTQQDNMTATLAILDSVDPHNLMISPGCDLPFNVPPENVIGCEQAVHQTAATRTIVAHYTAADTEVDVELPDYSSLERPLVEVFTIDPDTCPACNYMYQSALDAKEDYGDAIDVVEYRATKRENIARIKKMGVKHLPCIYVNGELVFSSIIPSRDELNGEIAHAMGIQGCP
jgi:uroporphyrinogen decarboxylase